MDELKMEMLELIRISGEMGTLNEMLLKYNELNSKSYNESRCRIIKDKISSLESRYYPLYEKWFKPKKQ
jgi:hypothetical protein